MSLINDVLKELEKREQRHRDIPYVPLVQYNTSSKFSISQKKIGLLVFSVFIFILLITFVSLFFIQPHSKLAPILGNTTFSSFESSIIDSNWLKPVFITGITLQVKDHITELSLLLDHAALYQLQSNDTQNQLSLIVDHAELQSALPVTQYLNTAIQQITTKKIHDGTQFIFTLYPGVNIKYVNLINEDKNPELVIAIESPSKEFNSSNDSTNQLVKTPVFQSLLSQQYRAALMSVKNNDYLSAINNLSSLIKAAPDYKDARVSLIALLINQGNTLKAKRYVTEGLALNPDYLPFIELKARILTLEGKIIQALALLQSTSPSIEENPEHYAFVAALYEWNNDPLFASKIYRQLVVINPRQANWWFGLGISLEKLKQTKAATEAYTNALSAGNLTGASTTYLRNRLRALEEDNNEKE